MPPPARHRFLTKRTRAERREQRKAVTLEEASITDNTRERYVNGLLKLLPVLEKVQSVEQLDYHLSAWIENSWSKGEAQYVISDALCGLHFYEPWTRGHLPNTWKLFATWRKLEIPARAPPIPKVLLRSFVAYALAHNDLFFAALLLLGFCALLRTGELLKVRSNHLLLDQKHGLVSLQQTKSGLRKGVNEMVHFEDALTLEVLLAAQAAHIENHSTGALLWPYSNSAFRNRFRWYCQKFRVEDFSFRPYSLRRGGATHHFQVTRSMDSALLMGRWESARVAKLYISDALSFLPSLRFSSFTLAMLQQYPSPL